MTSPSEVGAGWVYFFIVLALCGAAGWGSIRLLWGRSRGKLALGLLLLLVSAILPFFLGYGLYLGNIVAVVGAVVAAVQVVRQVGWLPAVNLILVVAFIAIEPTVSTFVGNLQEAATLDRCEGEVAVRTIEADQRSKGSFPADMHAVSMDSGEWDPHDRCPLYNNVNWVYQSGPTTYTIGYWRDWFVGKYVCLHSAGQTGWTCGLNRWGPFPPQEEEPLPPQHP